MKSKRGPKPTPWQERFKKRIKYVGDHWIWTGWFGRNGESLFFSNHNISSSSAAQLAHILVHGCKSNGRLMRNCEMGSVCVNPDHRKNQSGKNAKERNKEIVSRWENHLKYKTSMRELGLEYGITKQRIEQIIKEAGLNNE